MLFIESSLRSALDPIGALPFDYRTPPVACHGSQVTGRLAQAPWVDDLLHLQLEWIASRSYKGRAENLARLERKRKGKKLSNTDWVSKSDPEAKIAKMQDGTTHLAYKPEHAVDLDTGAVVAAELHPADEGDTTLRAQDPADAEAGAVGG